MCFNAYKYDIFKTKMHNTIESNDLQLFFSNRDKKRKCKKFPVMTPALLLQLLNTKIRDAKLKGAAEFIENNDQYRQPLERNPEDDEWEEVSDIETDFSYLPFGKMPEKVEIIERESDNDSENNTDAFISWTIKETVKSNPIETVKITKPQPTRKYVPPSMRGKDLQNGSVKQVSQTPNIENTVEFPSLKEQIDIKADDQTWSKVNKNRKTRHAEKQINKTVSSSKIETVPKIETTSKHETSSINDVTQSFFQKSSIDINKQHVELNKPEPVKYIPLYLRSKPTVNSKGNRFASLKVDEDDCWRKPKK